MQSVLIICIDQELIFHLEKNDVQFAKEFFEYSQYVDLNGLPQIDYSIKYDKRVDDYEEGLKANEEKKILWLHQRFDEIDQVQQEYVRKSTKRLGRPLLKQQSSIETFGNSFKNALAKANPIFSSAAQRELRRKIALKFIHNVLKRLIIIQRCTKRFGIVLEATNLELT